MSTPKHGLAPVMDAAAKAAQEHAMADRADELRQLDMLDPVTPEEIANVRQEMGFGAGRLAILAEARRRRVGRPVGAKNRRNDDLVKYLGQFGPDPLVGAMIVQGTPTEVLMELSGKTYLECLDRQIRCRELLAPYFHSKKPTDVNLSLPDFTLVEEIVEGGDLRPDEQGEFLAIEGGSDDDEGGQAA